MREREKTKRMKDYTFKHSKQKKKLTNKFSDFWRPEFILARKKSVYSHTWGI